MKKFGLVAVLLIAMLNILGAQEKYELTEVDIFSLEKPPLGSEVSVLGVSLGDSMDAVVKMFNKKEKDAKKYKMGFSFDVEDSMRIHFTPAKVVESMTVNPGLVSRLKGKTGEFFSTQSVARMMALLEGFGKPDYVAHKEIATVVMHQVYYLDGFSFQFVSGEMAMSIASKEHILLEAKMFEAEKVEKTEETVVAKDASRPPISTVGFRKALWGMSKEQVQGGESSKLEGEQKLSGEMLGLEVLMYGSSLAGLDCLIVYYFADNMLTKGRYIIREQHSNKTQFVHDYNNVKRQLTQKYGTPTADETLWLDDLYQDDPDDYGLAVSIGHLRYWVEWKPIETFIQAVLSGDNYDISFWIEYVAEGFKEFEAKIRKKAQEDIW